jgi:uncharacterized protein (DUF488 family)
MLNRQKVLVEFLKAADRSVSKFELTKWSFILRHEYPSAGGSSFYDFLPYQYGPFSFGLYQELDKLESTSYVHQMDDSIRIGRAELTQKLRVSDRKVASDIVTLVNRFGSCSRSDLTDHVYDRHPQYTCNSRLRKLVTRPIASPAVFTAGYEGRSIDSFLNLLVQSGIQRLIDVRRNPIARRYGFHKSTLDRLCRRLDIEYVHVPKLGIESEKRRNLNVKADYDYLFDEYRNTTLDRERTTLNDVAALMKKLPSVLVCMERHPDFCHRSSVADIIAKLTGLPIRNLGCDHECRAD